MADENDVLMSLYNDERAYARHHEEQRATMTNMIIGFAGIAVGITSVNGVDFLHLLLALFLMVAGIYGSVFCAKHYERHRYHSEMARGYRNALEKLNTNADISRNQIRSKHEKKYPLTSSWRLNRFWVAIHMFVLALGVSIGICGVYKIIF